MPYVVRAAQLIHIGGAGKELLAIYAAYRGSQEAHGTKLAEPSAYAVRHIECIEAEFLLYLYEMALAVVGGSYNMLSPAVPQLFPQYVCNE